VRFETSEARFDELFKGGKGGMRRMPAKKKAAKKKVAKKK
jgi:hypothetical protein